MESVFQTLDELVTHKIIEDYVVGGATALIYYSTPTLTEDIDVFVVMKEQGALVDLSRIYAYLQQTKGARVEAEYVFIDGFPVQFLVPYDGLSNDAFEKAVWVDYGGRKVKVFALEYLMAIMIQLNKPKYRERLRLLLESKIYDTQMLDNILTAHDLVAQWHTLRRTLENP